MEDAQELTLELLMEMRKNRQCNPNVVAWIEINWRLFIKTPEDMDFWRNDEYRDFGSGVYFLWRNDGGLLYVGQSVHVGNRVRHHDRYGRFDFYQASAISVPEVYLDQVEYAYINGLRPRMNLKYDSPSYWFDAHSDMESAVESAWNDFSLGS